MTNSFGITPQRQMREQVARPAAPTELAAPARPADEQGPSRSEEGAATQGPGARAARHRP